MNHSLVQGLLNGTLKDIQGHGIERPVRLRLEVIRHLFDACGIRIDEMPITAEKVWRALAARERQGDSAMAGAPVAAAAGRGK